MYFEKLTPERRLVNLAGRLSQQGDATLDICHLMGVDPDQNFSDSGRSAFNSGGSPLQLNLSSSRQGTRIRLLADPQTAPYTSPQTSTQGHWQERRHDAHVHLNRLLDVGVDSELAEACRAIANICLPEEVNPDMSLTTKAGIGFGMEMGTPGLAIYGHGPWSSQEEGWSSLLEKLPVLLPASAPMLEHIEKIRSVSTLHGIGMAGSNSRNARIKLYWKLTEPLRLDMLGFPLESHQPFIDFLNLVSQEKGVSLNTMFFCVGFDWKTGQFRDFKIDVCCCTDCLGLSQAKMIHILEEMGRSLDIRTIDLRSIIYRQEARFSLLGFGCDYKGDMRLNTYLSPCTPLPMPSNTTSPVLRHENSVARDLSPGDLNHGLERAVSYLEKRQMPNGAFMSAQSAYPSLEPEITQETSSFVTSNILYGLGFVSGDTATTLCHRGRQFLLTEMEPPGRWCYWSALYRTDLPADLDDSSCAALVLNGKVPAEFFTLDRQVFLQHRNRDGLFPTWTEPYQGKNDVDSVVNANVLAILGDDQEGKPVCDYLIGLLERGEEKESYWYYLNDAALYYALSRAIFLGVSGLIPARKIMLDRLTKDLEQELFPENPLEIALTLCILLNLKCERQNFLEVLGIRLLRLQNSQGNWEKTAYYGANTTGTENNFFRIRRARNWFLRRGT
ncbi:MAG: hypothetical protein JKX85_02385 [Phycisphaeraceae bacterium]|nr:hypothetical protein [Phycisphaeraceae bacterium]